MKMCGPGQNRPWEHENSRIPLGLPEPDGIAQRPVFFEMKKHGFDPDVHLGLPMSLFYIGLYPRPF